MQPQREPPHSAAARPVVAVGAAAGALEEVLTSFGLAAASTGLGTHAALTTAARAETEGQSPLVAPTAFVAVTAQPRTLAVDVHTAEGVGALPCRGLAIAPASPTADARDSSQPRTDEHVSVHLPNTPEYGDNGTW